MKEKEYPRKSGKIDIFGDEIWFFTPEAENDPPYSITFDSIEEWKKWRGEAMPKERGGVKSFFDGIDWLITGNLL